MARERCLRDRNSQLLAPGKSFKRVLDVLAAVQVQHAPRAKRSWMQSSHDSGLELLHVSCIHE